MAISHADHNHPNTPSARAACRKRMANGQSPRDESAERALAGITIPAAPMALNLSTGEITTRNIKRTTPKTSNRNVKRTATHLRKEHDLADVPRMLAHGCRMAWDKGWDVAVGERFNETEARIEIHAPLAIISLVWKDSNPEGLTALWIRNRETSVAYRLTAIQEGIDAGDNADAWGAHGAYVGL